MVAGFQAIRSGISSFLLFKYITNTLCLMIFFCRMNCGKSMWTVHEKHKISCIGLSSTLFHGLAWLDPSQEGGHCPLLVLILIPTRYISSNTNRYDYHHDKNILGSLSTLYIIISVDNVFVVTLQNECIRQLKQILPAGWIWTHETTCFTRKKGCGCQN